MAKKKDPFAIKHPGALTRKAAAAGMTKDAWARKHQHDPGADGSEARLYLNVFRPAAKARKGS